MYLHKIFIEGRPPQRFLFDSLELNVKYLIGSSYSVNFDILDKTGENNSVCYNVDGSFQNIKQFCAIRDFKIILPYGEIGVNKDTRFHWEVEKC